MTEVTMSRRVPAPADDVWELVGGFFRLADWHPAVSASEPGDDENTRRLTLGDGSQIVEELVNNDDGSRTYTYTMVHPGPLPVSNYKGTIHVEPDGQEAVVTWSSTFDPVGEAEQAQQALQDVYAAGLDNLRKLFSR
ncbi:Carbon monoxide dehydrogenase subunit G [Limimonas halophila]|uniref:Carbon monoxide dehydrogenase subunit G n=1 Tax=Limimonas halophila TaxID=1082479 RepID=A0A1G7UYH2_9PROT|nr:SRPBCC family protein [Limimonas halophila]SDG51760.1 Carbon monoxide dehydrogenase subunit G [Limimonas halophila]